MSLQAIGALFNKKKPLRRILLEDNTPTEDLSESTLLDMTPDRWIKSSTYRTQILYRMDVSMILYYSNLRYTSKVIESGTGTLGLTYALSKLVHSGRVDTVEYNYERYTAAQKDIIQANLSNTHVHHKAIKEYLTSLLKQPTDSFTKESTLTSSATDTSTTDKDIVPEERRVDGIILDIPEPEEVLLESSLLLRDLGRVLVFVPCIEQVQRAVKTIDQLPQLKIYKVFESIEIPHKPIKLASKPLPSHFSDNQPIPMQVFGTEPQRLTRGHTGYILVAEKIPF
ncbi:tRNA (adenine57-N1/adenine58-N1)-methyltransferase catalytic subunit [Nematocida sp. AWRm80]|nr:tRNA (adenine57-N1/adenine58-N1)-methyltransferase catalytic subunit [Nematocida sp. AWRm80]